MSPNYINPVETKPSRNRPPQFDCDDVTFLVDLVSAVSGDCPSLSYLAAELRVMAK